MPTYEYKCDKCGHQFEQMQSITSKSLRKCPKCGKSALRRLIGTGAGLIFKGSGFYATDYRSENYKESAKKEKPEKPSEKKESAAPAAKDSETKSKPKKIKPSPA
ncbi:MAG: zinc ribbon domain-containing protein [Sedimentisphaerales bacterium]|jgi:putative FmdB family regulatory protein